MKNERRIKKRAAKTPLLAGSSEVGKVVRYSRLRGFLRPTKQKCAYLLLLALFVGAAFAFSYVGVEYQNEAVYLASYWALMALSFPSFLLLQGYGTESIPQLGMPFYVFTIFMQSLWLYIISCSMSLFLRWETGAK